ncbi:hypothetical protein PO909_016634 [Leuciscus waleckii]
MEDHAYSRGHVTESPRKRKRELKRQRDRQINIGVAFPRWKDFKRNAEVVCFLLDRAVVKTTFVESKTSPRPRLVESKSRPSPKRNKRSFLALSNVSWEALHPTVHTSVPTAANGTECLQSRKGSSSLSSDVSSGTDHTPTKAPKNVATSEGNQLGKFHDDIC